MHLAGGAHKLVICTMCFNRIIQCYNSTSPWSYEWSPPHTHHTDGTPKRTAKLVKILRPEVDADFEVGPALFGPNLGENEFQVSAELVEPEPFNGCSTYSDELEEMIKGKIFLVTRGGCLFIQKVSRVYYAQ